jgi:hypothetical protein
MCQIFWGTPWNQFLDQKIGRCDANLERTKQSFISFLSGYRMLIQLVIISYII